MFLIYIYIYETRDIQQLFKMKSWKTTRVKGSSWSYIVEIFGGSAKVQGDINQELLRIIADIINIIEGSLICQLSKWCPY